MNLNLSNLCIEVTRACPMGCPHCLRGDARNEHLDLTRFEEWVSSLTSNGGALSICDITLSGGEPLFDKGLEKVIGVLDVFKRHNVEVGSFYIATSGFNLSRKAFLTCADWYAYCMDNETSQVQMSNDAYHDESMRDDEEGVRLFKGLSFFSNKFKDDGVEYKLVAQGHAVDNYQPRQMKDIIQKPDTFDVEADYTRYLPWRGKKVFACDGARLNEGTLYYNVKNNLIRGCDWSYDTQDNDASVLLCRSEEFIDALTSKLKSMHKKKEGESRW